MRDSTTATSLAANFQNENYVVGLTAVIEYENQASKAYSLSITKTHPDIPFDSCASVAS